MELEEGEEDLEEEATMPKEAPIERMGLSRNLTTEAGLPPPVGTEEALRRPSERFRKPSEKQVALNEEAARKDARKRQREEGEEGKQTSTSDVLFSAGNIGIWGRLGEVDATGSSSASSSGVQAWEAERIVGERLGHAGVVFYEILWKASWI